MGWYMSPYMAQVCCSSLDKFYLCVWHLCSRLEAPVGRAEVKEMANRETSVEIMESVREKSVYLIQTANPK